MDSRKLYTVRKSSAATRKGFETYFVVGPDGSRLHQPYFTSRDAAQAAADALNARAVVPERGSSLASRLFDLAEEWFNVSEDESLTERQQHIARKASDEMHALLGNPDFRPDGGESRGTS